MWWAFEHVQDLWALPQPAAPGFRIHLRPLRQGRRWPPLPSRGGAVLGDFCGFHVKRNSKREKTSSDLWNLFKLIFDESILCMYMQYIHQLMDWNFLNSCPSMLMNVHHLLYLHRSQKISFTILAADRIFKVVMNMVVKSSQHQKHCSSVSLLVLKHDDLCQWTCRFREVELFGKEEFDIHLCGTKDL